MGKGSVQKSRSGGEKRAAANAELIDIPGVLIRPWQPIWGAFDATLSRRAASVIRDPGSPVALGRGATPLADPIDKDMSCMGVCPTGMVSWGGGMYLGELLYLPHLRMGFVLGVLRTAVLASFLETRSRIPSHSELVEFQ